MRTILILPTGMLVVGIILSGMVFDSNLPFLQNNDSMGEANLTPDEAISIAVKDPKVSVFVRQTQAFVNTNYETDVWTVRFTDINLNSNYVQVEINDQSQLIVNTETSADSINQESQFNEIDRAENPLDQQISSEDIAIGAPNRGYGVTEDYFYAGNQEQVNAGIEYFAQTDIVKDYIEDNSIEFYGYSYENTVYLWGYSIENYEEWMGAILLADELTENSWEFTISEISSGSDFGNINYSFGDAIVLAKSTDEFKIFEENITDYTMNSILHYFAESNQRVEGFTYNIYFSSYSFTGDDEYVVAVDPVRTSDYSEGSESSDSSEESRADSICYCGDYNWIDVEIDENLWTVLEVWGPNSAQLLSDEAIELATEDPIIQTWSLEVGSVNNYAYYSGYGIWYIWMTGDENPYNYASASLNDRTGKVFDITTFLSVEATMTEESVNSLILETEGANEFFESVDNYESYLNYDRYGIWYFSYFDNDNYHNYIWGSLNDTDGTIINIEVRLYQTPNLSEVEVLSALSSSDINDFKEKYPDTVIYFYYDGYGTWYVSGNSLTLVEAWFWSQVDDESSEVIFYEENHPKELPSMAIDDVLGVVQATSEFKDMDEKLLQKFEYYYFMDGTWYYYLQGTSENSIYYWLSISIDDETGEIGDIWSSSWDYSDDYYTDPDYTNKDGDETVTVVAP